MKYVLSRNRNGTGGHWYFKTAYVCVMCKRELGVLAERRYTKKPKARRRRNATVDTICVEHSF